LLITQVRYGIPGVLPDDVNVDEMVVGRAALAIAASATV